MGNSQGVQLRQTSPFSSSGDSRGFGARKHFKEKRRWSGGATKFASPENRVLPPPIAGQRLRTTDNGHILQNGGTISGRKLAMLAQQRERRNESYDDEDYNLDLDESGDTTGADSGGASSQMLYGHKKSHSDPDIVHSMIRNDIGSDNERNLSKSIIAVSPSKAKIKSRKKSRAPEPPLSNTLPRDLDRIPMFSHYRKSGRVKSKTEVMNKSKSPAPPPPPPAGPPALDPQSAVYEKNKRGPSKWKISKSSSDLRNAETNEEPPIISSSTSRPAIGRMDLHRKSYGDIESKATQLTTVFDSRNSYNQKLAEHIKAKDSSRKDKPNLNKSFQEEIMAAVKKKSGFSRRNLCVPTANVVASQHLFGNSRSDQVQAAWSKEMRKLENENSEPDYEDVEEPISFCLNEDRYNKLPVWKNGTRMVESNLASNSPRFVRNEQPRASKIEIHIQKSSKQDFTAKTLKVDPQIKTREANNQVKTGLTEKELKRHTEQQRDMQLMKSRDNGKWIVRNTEEKLAKAPQSPPNQGLWANNKYPVDVENRHSLAKEIYLQQEQQKRSRNLNQIENNLYSKEWPKKDENEKPSSGSESEYTSSSESLKGDYEIGALMRPTLPRKSLEIPQFSPTQAWKCLVVDQPLNSYFSDLSSDEGEVMEDKIRHSQKPVAPRRTTIERCTDSGISPDAGSPLPNHDRGELPLHQQTRRPGVGQNASPTLPSANNWIPQQDLMDDSDLGSVEHFQPSHNVKNEHYWTETSPENGIQTKQSFPYGIFSGRQPTEIDGTYQLKILPVDKQKNRNKKKNKSSNGGQHFNSLRSLKKVLGLKLKVAEEKVGLDTNWSLSRSTPTINNETDKTMIVDINLRHSPSENMLNTKRQLDRTDSRPLSNNRMEYRAAEEEPFTRAVKPQIELIKENKITKMKKKNRFSYQNTIRREEKKQMEEKLNQEVARREMKREKEIQWMNKVEEEFRKRRDREKINIRYQLKMLNDEDASFEWDPTDIPVAERESRSLPYIPLHSPAPGTKSNSSPPIQKQVKNEAYHVNESADLRTPSSTTASSPDIPQWPQSTGMSKWLRKKKCQKPSSNSKQKQNINAPRPEPEGGRSSGDEHRSLEINKDRNGQINHLSSSNYKLSSPSKQENRKVNSDLKNKDRVFSNGYHSPKRDHLIQAFHEGPSVESDCLENFINRVDKNVKSNVPNTDHAFQSRVKYNAKHVENKKVPKEQSDFLNVDNFQSELLNRLKTKTPSKEQTKTPVDGADGVFARGHPHRSGGRAAKLGPNKLSPDNPSYLPQPYSPKKVYRSIPFDLVISSESPRDSSSGPRHITQQDLRTAVEAR